MKPINKRLALLLRARGIVAPRNERERRDMLAKQAARESDIISAARQILTSRGGKARAKKLSPARRREIASIAARARWSANSGI